MPEEKHYIVVGEYSTPRFASRWRSVSSA